MDLRQLQQHFKKALQHDLKIARELPIKEDPTFSKDLRLDIYQYGFYDRLSSSIAEDFPNTLEKIGNADFTLKKFLCEYPSRFANPAEYSVLFLDYVDKYHPELKGSAQREWNIILANLAKDVAAMDPQSLGALAPAALMQLRLRLHPSISLCQDGAQYFMTYRWQGRILETTLTKEKYNVLAKILQNKSIEEIIEEHQDENLFFELFSFLASKQLIQENL